MSPALRNRLMAAKVGSLSMSALQIPFLYGEKMKQFGCMINLFLFLSLLVLGFIAHGVIVYPIVSYFTKDGLNSSISSAIYSLFTFPASLWYFLSWKYDLPGLASLPEFVTYSFWGMIYAFIVFQRIGKSQSKKTDE